MKSSDVVEAKKLGGYYGTGYEVESRATEHVTVPIAWSIISI